MSDRFPCIAEPFIYSGHEDVYRSPARGGTPELIVRQASRPKQLADGRVLMARNAPGTVGDGAVLAWNGQDVTEFVPPGLEGWSCDNGLFAGWRRDDRLKALTRSSDRHTAGLIDLGGISSLEIDSVEIDRGPIYDVRYTGETLVWSKEVRGQRRTYGRIVHGAPTEDLTVLSGHEFWPVVISITTAFGPETWVLNHGDEHCFMRPWGPQQYQGHIVRVGITDRPDARQLADGLVLVAFSDHVSLQREFVDLHAPTVDVRRGVTAPPADPPLPPQPPQPPEETPVELTERHSELMAAFDRRFPAPVEDESDMREWTGRLAQQMKHSTGEDWGQKSTTEGSTISFDVIARRVGSKVFGWDLARGGGSPGATLQIQPREADHDLTRQHFISVDAHDFLGKDPGEPEEPEGPGTPAPAPTDLRPVIQRLDALSAQVAQLLARPVPSDTGELTHQIEALRTFVEHDGVVGRLLVIDNKLSQLLARREPEKCRFPRFAGAAPEMTEVTDPPANEG